MRVAVGSLESKLQRRRTWKVHRGVAESEGLKAEVTDPDKGDGSGEPEGGGGGRGSTILR